MKLIINADDFGKSHEINMAIVEAFNKGYITNTTIMVNMPGFEEAIELAEKYGFKKQVGLHLNLLEGKPLTPQIAADKYFSKGDNLFSKDIIWREAGQVAKFVLPNSTKKAIRIETEAQIQKYLNAGFTQLHIDSHCHAHTIYSLYSVIKPVLKKYNFKSIRKTLNFYGQKRNKLIILYKRIYNFFLERHFNTTDYFSSAEEYLKGNNSLLKNNDICEMMVHPCYKNNELINKGSSKFEKIVTYQKNFEMISYSDLSR